MTTNWNVCDKKRPRPISETRNIAAFVCRDWDKTRETSISTVGVAANIEPEVEQQC